MRIGSLFSGYGGLDAAVVSVLGGDVAWHVEFDKAPSAALAHRFPGVPNYGDVTAVDWAAVEPVDVLTGGFPCQDLSHAGKRAGLRPGTRSGLWEHMAYAISELRPRLVVIENVRGLLSAEAHSDVEPCPWCVGDGSGDVLRALGAVLGDLAGLGYDAVWGGVRASDAGAAHGRFRVFIVAHPEHADGVGCPRRGSVRDQARSRQPVHAGVAAADADQPGPQGAGEQAGSDTGRQTPDTRGRPAARRRGATPVHAEGVQQREPSVRRPVRAELGHGADARPVPVDLLPTTRATDGTKGGPNQAGSSGDLMLPSAVQPERFGPYQPAIDRWASVLGRPAPAPTEPGAKGSQRLSPRFVEWLMGLDDGWVTGVPGLSRAQQLKMLGNGVVPQQAELALRLLLGLPAESSDGVPGDLLPTPVVNDMGDGKAPPQWDAWCDAMKAKHGNGNGHGKSLAVEVRRHDLA